jgi:hypothetical protein
MLAIYPDFVLIFYKVPLEQADHGFKSYIQVQQWLEDTLGVKAEYRTVHQLTRYRLNAKLKAARPTSSKQNPEQTEAFKKTLQIT